MITASEKQQVKQTGITDEAAAHALFQNEGFEQVYTRKVTSNTEYPEHTHPVPVAHIVIVGGLVSWQAEHEYVLGPGDRLDLPKGVSHRSVIGATGCTYVVAIRI
jgi:quercetin dioxygenase-like cupin family protein